WTPDHHDRFAIVISGRYSGLLGTNHNSNFKWTPRIHSDCCECKSYMFFKWKLQFRLNGIDETTIK
ncbi:hypothetical protein HAX54_007174, partial [Datura stramonium]|nr:hypothetical protein [Datura stramonium]